MNLSTFTAKLGCRHPAVRTSSMATSRLGCLRHLAASRLCLSLPPMPTLTCAMAAPRAATKDSVDSHLSPGRHQAWTVNSPGF